MVTKFSANILGKNWIKLRDGTGTAPDDKPVVTSSEIVAVGDEVVVRGLIKSNVNIGAGYNYKVLLELTSFSHGGLRFAGKSYGKTTERESLYTRVAIDKFKRPVA